MITDLVTRNANSFIMAIQDHPPMRLTRDLDNGNMVILQIVDPEDVPEVTKAVRKIPGKIGRLVKSIEAAIRVGWIVFQNSMRKKDASGNKGKGRGKGKKVPRPSRK